MLKKILFIVSLISGICFHTGCCFHQSSLPMLPSTWNGNECDAKSLEDDPAQAKLHVMIMYRGGSCTHTALRLYCQSKGPIFWDPAGGFATHHNYAGPARRHRRFDAPTNLDSVRRKDVIIEKVPSINQYLDWRKRIQTHGVEIFEFNISDDEAEKLWSILRFGTRRSHPKGAFGTNALGGNMWISNC